MSGGITRVGISLTVATKSRALLCILKYILCATGIQNELVILTHAFSKHTWEIVLCVCLSNYCSLDKLFGFMAKQAIFCLPKKSVWRRPFSDVPNIFMSTFRLLLVFVQCFLCCLRREKKRNIVCGKSFFFAFWDGSNAARKQETLKNICLKNGSRKLTLLAC